MSKRIFDICASLLGLVLLSPVFLVVCLLIRISMRGPCLFLQERVGRHGEPFIIFKFRSMSVDHGGSTISIKGEKRITPLGSVLRKYKIDELPELWNVLRGDMSIVGPRPDMKAFTDRLVGEEKLILELRPGITGPASLKYRNEEELLSKEVDPHRFNDEVIWPDKVQINLDYFYKNSLWGDIRIILRTVF